MDSDAEFQELPRTLELMDAQTHYSYSNTNSKFTTDSSQLNCGGRQWQGVSDEVTSGFFNSYVGIVQCDNSYSPFDQGIVEKLKVDLMKRDLCGYGRNYQCCPSLKFFYTISLKKPTNAYFRTKLIKGHKKFQKNTLRNKVSRKRPCLTTINHILAKEKLINHILDNINTFEMYCYSPRNCNNHYCEYYFTDQIVAESFDLYIAYLFSFSTCGQLSKKFYIKCCTSDIHNDKCIRLWRNLEAEMEDYVAAQRRYVGPKEIGL